MLQKSFDIQRVDEVADGGEITAYASTFDRIPDSYGDIVAPGAFTKSLEEWKASGRPIPLLFGHRTDDPRMNVGAVVDAVEDEKGLLVRAKFDPDSEIAQYTRKLVMEGRLAKLSFAYETLDSAPVVLDGGVKANELRELKLYEVSLVPIPANDLTFIVDAKAGDDGDTDNDLHENEAEDVVEEKADAKADDTTSISDALSAIRQLADRLDEIADMIDDMAERIGALMPAADDTQKDNEGIDIKSDDEVIDQTDDNAEATHDGNAEVDVKGIAETLAKMTRYISIS